jgi:hypothetical protein
MSYGKEIPEFIEIHSLEKSASCYSIIRMYTCTISGKAPLKVGHRAGIFFFRCVNYSRMYSVWNMYLRTYSIHLRATASGSVRNVADD